MNRQSSAVAKAPTIRDVAERAGTSVSAVSAALNGGGQSGKGAIRVSEATREKIARAASELGYASNPLARSLATGRTGVIGLMLPYSGSFTEHDPFLTLVTNGVVEEAVRQRLNVMLYTATSEAAGGLDAVPVDARVDGAIVVLPRPDSPTLAHCARLNIPAVSVLRLPQTPEEWVVNSDDRAGGRLATGHLLALGHRRIAHLTGDPAVPTSAPRQAGYLDALEEAGVAPDPAWTPLAGFSREGGHRAAVRLLALPPERRPTALFAANDLCAHGAMQAVREGGRQVPGDVAVVGYDDSWYSTLTTPPLTTVHMAIESLGAEAARLLKAQISGQAGVDRQPVLPVRLTVRESCGSSPRPHPSTTKAL